MRKIASELLSNPVRNILIDIPVATAIISSSITYSLSRWYDIPLYRTGLWYGGALCLAALSINVIYGMWARHEKNSKKMSGGGKVFTQLLLAGTSIIMIGSHLCAHWTIFYCINNSDTILMNLYNLFNIPMWWNKFTTMFH
jgi:hypothetical protein